MRSYNVLLLLAALLSGGAEQGGLPFLALPSQLPSLPSDWSAKQPVGGQGRQLGKGRKKLSEGSCTNVQMYKQNLLIYLKLEGG